MNGNDFALKEMDRYYEQMNGCTSTSGRNYNFKKMLAIWNSNPIVQKVWEYIADAYRITKRFVKRVVSKVVPSVAVNAKSVETNFPEGSQLVYLTRLLDRDGELIWSKVGTTTRSIKTRMAEHLRYYRKYGVTEIEVTRVWNCGELPAEGLESEFRAKYMKKYPGTFRKNDRFAGVEFDLEEADKIVENYLLGA
jgi:hypothetical protein